ncbi:hypothetical protein AWZ03_001024 [Drosophila navojoa]|uniref:Uncharacterized protein n=1 Tax=Drosophila navojoa TaxID=7232 RepID=A0A484BZ52_DRONA|nr:hypothetical protein AWZ03_001024 [Drosophila navojoa]
MNMNMNMNRNMKLRSNSSWNFGSNWVAKQLPLLPPLPQTLPQPLLSPYSDPGHKLDALIAAARMDRSKQIQMDAARTWSRFDLPRHRSEVRVIANGMQGEKNSFRLLALVLSLV